MVKCSECGEEIVVGYLEVHKQTQHGKSALGRLKWETTSPEREPKTYRMEFPTTGGTRNYPVEGCWGWTDTRTAMKVHLLHQHVRDTVIILEEGPPPPPPRVTPVQHYGALKGPERAEHHHSSVHQGGR